jgi:hypothetical protein
MFFLLKNKIRNLFSSMYPCVLSEVSLLDSHAPSAGKGFAEGEPSENFETAKGSLPRALYRAHGKAFAEG